MQNGTDGDIKCETERMEIKCGTDGVKSRTEQMGIK
jgi:hypothetical protein